MERAIEDERRIWQTRVDCPIRYIEVWYDDVLKDPEGAMQTLKAAGFPIRDIRRAARVIDSQRPLRFENVAVA
jgi:hypothetical protein